MVLIRRLSVIAILLPAGLAINFVGGWPYLALIGFFLGVAAWEYAQLFHRSGHQPAGLVVVAGVLLILAARYFARPLVEAGILTAVILTATVFHLRAYERGRSQAAIDLALTLAGVVYVGWLGAHFLSLRLLPQGEWWVVLTLAAVWLSDVGGYLIGKSFGRRPLSPRLSPKKTWEGYLGGVLFGLVGTPLLAALLQASADPGPGISPLAGLVLGSILAVLAPLGDLGESLLKRQAGVKDSGNLLPGHGGALDRIDSILWGAAIGYYVIAAVFI